MTTTATTPPQPLTWTHLLPTSMQYDCQGGPDWFVEQLAAGERVTAVVPPEP